jgi:Ca2+-binding RTX toxin-like protein
LPQVNELAREQYMLELINRARMNPAGEAARYHISLNKDLAPGTLNSTAKQVLAGSLYLSTSADKHSSYMLSHDQFAHQAIGDGNPGSRMAAAGYAFTGSYTWGENIAWSGAKGSGSTAFYDAQLLAEHGDLFKSAGHRENILEGDFKEIGIGAQVGNFTYTGSTYGALMTTQNFAKSGDGSFITGVAYADTVKHDQFYSIGEGKVGLAVKLYDSMGTVLKSTTTASAGGYALKTAATGTLETVFSGATLAGDIGVKFALGEENVKVDVVGSHGIAANVSVTLTHAATELQLLGIQGINGSGNGLKNVLHGNAGSNTLRGNGNADTLFGDGGNDKLIGGSGVDKLTGGAGADHFRFMDAGDGGDTITDMAAADVIEFSASGFGLAAGAVNATQFVTRAADNHAHDGNDRFIYQQDAHTLWFDGDGDGVATAVKIALITNNYSVTAADLLIV